MPGKVIEFWFEFASTYSHIAAHRIERVAAAAGVTLSYRAFLLGPIFRNQGWNDSPFNIYPAKGAYMWKDMARTCEKHGVPFRKPSVFPRNGLLAARVGTAAGAEPWIGRYVSGVYLANYRDDLDISSPEVIRSVLDGAGCADPAATLSRAESPEVKELLRRRTEEAVARGVFGAPSFFAGDELFWGNDRLEDAIAWSLR